MDTVKPGQFNTFATGMNNRAPDFKLATQTVAGESTHFMRSIVNSDVTKEGSLHRRAGYERVVSGTACRSLWSDGKNTFYADGSNLIRLSGESPFVATTMYSSLLADHFVSYAAVNSDVYWTDGQVLRRIDATGDHPNGVALMEQEPTITASLTGSMQPGVYSVCCTFGNADGEESGTTSLVQLEVTNGIDIIGLPAAWPADVTSLWIYMTSPNGAELMLAQVLTSPAVSVSFVINPTLSERCITLLMAPMPAGDIVRYLNGRLFVAVGSTLYYSEPYALSLRSPTRNYIQFPERITVLEPVNNGFFVIADQTYWVAGDVVEAELNPVLPYGAVFGTGVQIPNENAACWMSTRGLVRGEQDGSVKNLQEQNVAVDPAALGASSFMERDGMKQAVSSLFGAEPTQMTAHSYMDAEIVRKGTTI